MANSRKPKASDTWADKKCDICGSKASNAAIDVKATANPGDAYYTYSTTGAVKYGCDKHPSESITHVQDPLDVIFDAMEKCK